MKNYLMQTSSLVKDKDKEITNKKNIIKLVDRCQKKHKKDLKKKSKSYK
ncbi:MAG: hypothetical protein L6V81_01335 [Clostridium sp.]|nr:MAG: hypothetical protein L6V81_01335 [Clostridium sp.]